MLVLISMSVCDGDNKPAHLVAEIAGHIIAPEQTPAGARCGRLGKDLGMLSGIRESSMQDGLQNADISCF
jgi:hypothetical protein